MPSREAAHIFSASQRNLWHSFEPHIWTLDGGHLDRDPALPILRTLFDQPRWLEAHLLYDERGSRLFEEICDLPEYYLTRTEEAILAKEAERVIALAPVQCIVELGAGSAKKTLHLLREQMRQRRRGTFAPIDVSLASLSLSRDIVKERFPQMEFHGLRARYEEGISSIEKSLPTLFVFLGSTVGNFRHSEFSRFFGHLSQSMGADDFLLLGVDRVKEAEILEKAYHDSRGVTAGFILNVFHHINRLAGSNFDPRKMRYHSWYDREWQQVEMHAISTATQEIRFPPHATSFIWERDESILVEISRKFEPVRLQQQLQYFGLQPVAHFTDSKEWFSVLLLRKSDIVSL